MATIDVKIEGGEELLRKLRQLDTGTAAALGAAVEAGARLIDEIADGMAPGPHIEHEVVARSDRSATAAIGPDKEHWYYRFAETGAKAHTITGSPLVFEGRRGTVFTGVVHHPGFGARPFLRPAMDGNVEKARDKVGGVLKRAVEAV